MTEQQYRGRLVSLRLTPAEYRVASERAATSGRTVSQVLRDGITGYGVVIQSVYQQTFVNGALHSSIANVEWSVR